MLPFLLSFAIRVEHFSFDVCFFSLRVFCHFFFSLKEYSYSFTGQFIIQRVKFSKENEDIYLRRVALLEEEKKPKRNVCTAYFMVILFMGQMPLA